MTPRQMREILAKAGFDEYADLIESQAQRCVRFNLTPTEEHEISVGETKLGGAPDLPSGTDWPIYLFRTPLDFVMQINLDDLISYRCCNPLPSEGILYFFYDAAYQPNGLHPRYRDRWQVIFHQGPRDDLRRMAFPAGVFPAARLKPCRTDFYEALSPGWEEIPVDVPRQVDRDTDDYRAFIETLPTEKAHQVLGRPGRIKSFEYLMQLDCQFVSNGLYVRYEGRPLDEDRAKELEPGAIDWKLLLQLDSDEKTGMNWGEGSALTFWIREEDLRQRDFTHVWVILQCL